MLPDAATTTTEPIEALLADDHALYRGGLRRTLNALGIRVVGEASNGRDAVKLTRELKPDVVVLDLHMPIMTGVEATRAICELRAPPPVVVLADRHSDDAIDAVLAGALSCLMRDDDVTFIAHGLRRAAAGDATLSPRIAARLVDRLRAHERTRDERKVLPASLTEREQAVLRLVATGRDNSSIGRELYISASTVKHHVAAILDKLGASNRAQAAADAVRFGIV